MRRIAITNLKGGSSKSTTATSLAVGLARRGRRVLLIDGPSVLGWERWRAMEEHHALGLIRAVLQLIADEGKLRPESVATLGNILLASVNEVALLVARSDDREAAMQAGADAIDELLRRLFS